MSPKSLGKFDRLAGCHPTLIEKVQQIFGAMDWLGLPMVVTDGVRTVDQQKALYAQGRTKPGKIVTNCDGVTKKSNHQQKADGFGHAVDCCFLKDVDGDGDLEPTWPDAREKCWEIYALMAEQLGLYAGRRFGDSPHISMEKG